jgi:hypothetical protein
MVSWSVCVVVLGPATPWRDENNSARVQHGPLCIYVYRGGGGGPNASVLELLNDGCCLAVASGGIISCLNS